MNKKNTKKSTKSKKTNRQKKDELVAKKQLRENKTFKEKKTTLRDLTLADGKIVEDPEITKIKKLEKILGIEKSNPFRTTSLDVFKERLSEMTLIDMQHMCEKIGIFGSGSRQDLKNKLLREFKSTNKGTISMTVENPALILDPENPKHKKAIKILGEF
jgi:hypothetical protein